MAYQGWTFGSRRRVIADPIQHAKVLGPKKNAGKNLTPARSRLQRRRHGATALDKETGQDREQRIPEIIPDVQTVPSMTFGVILATTTPRISWDEIDSNQPAHLRKR